MPKIRAVFFDIDNTLFPTDKFAEFARRRAIRAMVKAGLKASEGKAYRTLTHVVRKHGSNYPQHFDRLLERLGAPRDPKLIAAGILAYHQAKSELKPYPDVPPTLCALRRKGLPLYALSRGIAVKQWDKLILLGLGNLFDGVFVTNRKDVHFYSRVIRKLRLQPSSVVMVGDNPRIDTAPARRAGITTVRLIKGKHAKEKGAADFRIHSMRELPRILRRVK